VGGSGEISANFVRLFVHLPEKIAGSNGVAEGSSSRNEIAVPNLAHCVWGPFLRVFLRYRRSPERAISPIHCFREPEFRFRERRRIACKYLWKIVFGRHSQDMSQSGIVDAMEIGKSDRAK